MKLLKKIICLLLSLAVCFGCASCASQTAAEDEAETIESAATAESDTEAPTAEAEDAEESEENEDSADETEEEEELSEITLAEMEILDAIDYSNYNFLTEAEFYDLLSQILALHGLEMTRYSGSNAYYCFNYSNLGSVKLLTIAQTMDEIEADRAEAIEEWEAQVAAYQAAVAGDDSDNTETEETDAASTEDEAVTDDEDETDAAAEAEVETVNDTEAEDESNTATNENAGADEEESEEEIEFDASKDVESSDDYVISFVLSATDSEDDQQVMFLVSAAVWAIMNPHYNNTDDAFTYLWRGLYTIYAQTEGASASTIDGFDTSYTFTIPGNGIEAWLGTDDSGNYILAITMYAVYDELIDIAGTTGTELQTATSSLLG